MTSTRASIFALCFLAPALAASADQQLRATRDITLPSEIANLGAPHTPVGIEGNGLLGIEGNGIIQRLNANEIVLNDSLLELGPGTVRVRVDAYAATIDAIQPGHVVLAGAFAPGQGPAPMVARIELDHLVRGPIDVDGVDVAAGAVRVLGQRLVIPEFAELAEGMDGLAVEDLSDGEYLRVSGWLDNEGVIVPTRIERTAPLPDVLEVTGRVASLDSTGMTLVIGELTADYASAQFIYMTAGELTVGDRVEIVGNLLSPGGELLATYIRRAPLPLSAQKGLEVEVQGYADGPVANNEFTLAGQTIRVDSATIYERGIEADVAAGSLLEVEGEIEADGTLLAQRVEFDAEVVESEIRIAASVQSVNQSLQNLQIFGLTVSASLATRFEDKTDSATPFDDFGDIEPGAFLDLRGYDDPDGGTTVTTTRVTREMPDTSFIKARVTSNDGSAIEVLGLSVSTNAGTSFVDAQGAPLSESQFVALAQVGVLVKVTGTPSAGGIDASELELE